MQYTRFPKVSSMETQNTPIPGPSSSNWPQTPSNHIPVLFVLVPFPLQSFPVADSLPTYPDTVNHCVSPGDCALVSLLPRNWKSSLIHSFSGHPGSHSLHPLNLLPNPYHRHRDKIQSP